MELDELLDLVDENDNVIGTKKRSEIYEKGLSNFRVVDVFLENSRGQLWIPRRSGKHTHFPFALDMSMGGHVASGESYEEALRRELREELNINLDEVECDFLGYLTPHSHGLSAFTKVYRIRTEESPQYNRDDFQEGFWITPEKLLEKIDNGEPAKDDLEILVRNFFAKNGNTAK